jgi:hypothetical protein
MFSLSRLFRFLGTRLNGYTVLVCVLVLNLVRTKDVTTVEGSGKKNVSTEVENRVGPKMVVVGITTEVMNVGTVWICTVNYSTSELS